MGNIDDIRDILRGAIASLGGFGGRMIARLILMITAGQLYGAIPLGLLGQVAAITEILAAVAVLGLKRSLLDLMSEDEKEGRDPQQTIIAALVVSLGLGAAMSLLLALVWPILFPDLQMPILLYGAIPGIVFAEVAGAAIRFRRIIRWEVVARCVLEPWSFLIAAVLLYFADAGAAGLLSAYAVSALAAAVGIVLGLNHVFTLKSLFFAGTNWRRLLAVPRRSMAVGITDVGTMMFRRLDILVLSLVVGHGATGVYYMAQQIVTVPHKIHQLFEPMLSPVLAKLHHAAEKAMITTKLASICRWVFTLQLALTVPLLIFGEEVLSLFGPDFAVGALVLTFLLLAELIDGSFALTETPLVFARPTIPPKLVLLALAVEVTAIYSFATMWGVPGAALGFLAAMAALTMMRLFNLKRQLAINVLSFSYIWPLVFAGTIGASLAAIKSSGLVAGSWEIGAVMILAIAFNVVLIRFLALTPMDRQLFRQLRSG